VKKVWRWLLFLRSHLAQIPAPPAVSDAELAAAIAGEDSTQYRVSMSVGEQHAEVDNGASKFWGQFFNGPLKKKISGKRVRGVRCDHEYGRVRINAGTPGHA
jgi:hypothetical protein